MKTPSLLLSRLSLALVLGPTTLLAQEQPQKPTTETAAESAQTLSDTIEREIAEANRPLQDKIAAVEAAIAKAEQAGTIRSSTAAFHREALERLKTPSGQIPQVDRSTYSVKFDPTDDIEPIRAVWADMARTVSQAQAKLQGLTARVLTAIAESFQTAARTAAKPEDLAETDKLIAAARQLPEPSSGRFSQGTSPIDLFSRLSESMRNVLAAKEKGDTERLITELKRFQQTSNTSSYASISSRYNIPIRTETLWDTFRARLAEPYLNASKEAQAEVEKRIIARQPTAEIEKAIIAFEAASGPAERISRDTGAGYVTHPDTRASLVRTYRSILDALRTLETGGDPSRSSSSSYLSNILLSPDFTGSVELRTFVSGLQAELRKKQQELQDQAESRRKEEEVRRMAKAQQEAREALSKAIAKARERISSIRTPKEALAVADELPSLLPVPSANRYQSDSGEATMAWRQAEQELRQIGTAWSDDSLEMPAMPTGNPYERSGGIFIAELRELRDRATRDVFARRFNAPELQQAPLAEMNTRAAMEKLADDAATKGDWRRCLELLQAVAPRSEYRIAGTERIQAIRSYLSALNFEQAELFPEALAAYQVVLQQTASGIPLKETAERVKQLRASRPELFKPAAPATSGNPPPARPLPGVTR